MDVYAPKPGQSRLGSRSLTIRKGTKMSLKLKALGLGLLAMLAMGAMAAIQASAETSGHFYNHNGGNPTFITGTEGPEKNHRIKFRSDGGTPIECDEAIYHAETSATTTQELTVTPTWKLCHTEGGAAGTVVVDHNGCHLVFTSNSKATGHNPTTDATVHVVCPAGKAIEVTHPNCTMRMPPQTTNHAVTYTPDVVNGQPAITLNATAENITAHYHAGICIFLGTTHKGTMIGSATVHARDIDSNPVGITAT